MTTTGRQPNGTGGIPIHIPHVGDDNIYSAGSCFRSISIHIPHVGDDDAVGETNSSLAQFQSTSPMRGKTRPEGPVRSRWAFQSTSPVWGMTSSMSMLRRFASLFQSTSPVWGMTRPAHRPEGRGGVISIHIPRVGDDILGSLNGWKKKISIHIPRVGDDLCAPLL